MQTFVPFPDIYRIAEVLDTKRLFKQVVEAKQILLTLRAMQDPDANTKTLGWRNHPAVRMWKGYEGFLSKYLQTLLVESIARGVNADPAKYDDALIWARKASPVQVSPGWWNGDIHYTHRVNLCAKDWDHYAPLFVDVFDDDVGKLGYHWPARKDADTRVSWVIPDRSPPIKPPDDVWLGSGDKGFQQVVLDEISRIERARDTNPFGKSYPQSTSQPLTQRVEREWEALRSPGFKEWTTSWVRDDKK